MTTGLPGSKRLSTSAARSWPSRPAIGPMALLLTWYASVNGPGRWEPPWLSMLARRPARFRLTSGESSPTSWSVPPTSGCSDPTASVSVGWRLTGVTGDPSSRIGSPASGSDDFAGLVDYCDDYAPGARRYDMGEVSNFALLPVAIASMELLAGWGLDAVAAHAQTLTSAIASGAADLGFGVAARAARSPHLLGLRLPAGLDTAVVAAHLREHRGARLGAWHFATGVSPRVQHLGGRRAPPPSPRWLRQPSLCLQLNTQCTMKLVNFCQRWYGSIPGYPERSIPIAGLPWVYRKLGVVWAFIDCAARSLVRRGCRRGLRVCRR